MGGTFSSSKKKSSVKKSAHEVLRMPHVTLGDIENIMKSEDDKFQSVSLNSHDTVEATVKYSAYLHRQEKDMDSWRKAQGLLIPPDIVYDRTNFPTLKEEELQLLKKFRPGTLGDANSIQGITPQGLVYLQQFVRKRGRKRDRNRASQI